MRKLLFIGVLIFSISIAEGQEIKVIKIDALEQLMQDTNGKTRVINFWATWCRPCIVEMPYFEKAATDFKDQNVEVVLISLDFVEKLDKVKGFVERKGIQSKVVLLDEMDYNAWIDKVDPSWSGAIPATIIINSKNKQRAFFEQEFHEGELEKTIQTFINQKN